MKMLRLKDVIALTGLGRSTIYKFISEGSFPKPVPLGGRAVVWVEEEVQEWLMTKIQQRDEGTD